MSISTLILISIVSLLLVGIIVNKFIVIPELKQDLELKIKKYKQISENFYSPVVNYPGDSGSGYTSGMGGPGYTSGMGGPGYTSGMGGPGYTSGMGGPGYTSGMGGPGYTSGMGGPGSAVGANGQPIVDYPGDSGPGMGGPGGPGSGTGTYALTNGITFDNNTGMINSTVQSLPAGMSLTHENSIPTDTRGQGDGPGDATGIFDAPVITNSNGEIIPGTAEQNNAATVEAMRKAGISVPEGLGVTPDLVTTTTTNPIITNPTTTSPTTTNPSITTTTTSPLTSTTLFNPAPSTTTTQMATPTTTQYISTMPCPKAKEPKPLQVIKTGNYRGLGNLFLPMMKIDEGNKNDTVTNIHIDRRTIIEEESD